MRNYIQPGKVLTVTALAAVLSGDPLAVGSLFGVVATNASTGEQVEMAVEGVYELPKTVTDVMGVGDPLYWNSSTKKVTKTAGTGSKMLVGVATEVAPNGSTVVRMKLLTTGVTGPA